MTAIKIVIGIDNDAFNDRLSEELQHCLNAADIVNALAECMTGDACTIRDSNGEACGYAVTLTERSHTAEYGEFILANGGKLP